jgi:choline kinase
LATRLAEYDLPSLRLEYAQCGAFLHMRDFLTSELTTQLVAAVENAKSDFEAGDEPVKLCVRDGVPIELRKEVAADLQFDTIGESVGFFRFDEAGARRLAALVAAYVASDRAHMPHEEAVRDLLQERSQIFEVTDVTGFPWIEIDYSEDVARAAAEVLPLLQPLSA